MLASAASANSKAQDPRFIVMSDAQFTLLEVEFAVSKAAGKPWQLFLSSVMMSPHVGLDP